MLSNISLCHILFFEYNFNDPSLRPKKLILLRIVRIAHKLANKPNSYTPNLYARRKDKDAVKRTFKVLEKTK